METELTQKLLQLVYWKKAVPSAAAVEMGKMEMKIKFQALRQLPESSVCLGYSSADESIR